MSDPNIDPEKASPDVNDDTHDDIMYPSSVAFILVHLACFGALWSGITWQAIAISVILFGRIGAGYHRYFSHRAYSTGRVFQFVLATMSQSSAQKSV
jgi:stearoyl-CoA desaturase (Delta-9 desaturase)